jgi:hypothetical protein
MKLSTMITLSTAMAGLAFASSAGAAEYRIGITQNNVGVDSYQTTYEEGVHRRCRGKPNVEAVVLDAGGDVARQIAQMEDLIQQEVDAIIIWPTNGEAVIPAVRKANQAGHSGHRDQFQHRRSRASTSSPPSPGPTTSRRVRVRPRSCATSSRKWGSRTKPRSCRSPASPATPPPSSAPRASRTAFPKSART